MSYCVNCGVELDRSEKACPLCGVAVLNPRQPYDDQAPRPYPKRLDPIYARINRRFTAAVLSIILAFPGVFCLAINFILDGVLTWSLYVAGALALVWVFLVPYFLYSKPTVIKIFLPGVPAISLYLLLIAKLQGNHSWFLTLAMPMVIVTCGLIFLNIVLINAGKISGFAIPAAILVSAGLLTTGIELIINFDLTGRLQLGWSLFVLIPTVAIAAFFLAAARRQSIREEIRKRLHL